MRIKLAVVVNDKNYLSRICSVLDTEYADKLETYYFSDINFVTDSLKNGEKYDVILADTSFDVVDERFLKKSVFAFFSDSNDIETYKDKPCIGKYQKVDVIFREILRLYSEQANNNVVFKSSDNSGCSVISVVSAAGGVGSSTIAAAIALHKQQSGANVIYINLEAFGSTNMFFSAPGEGDFSNIIFALKSKKSNLSFKLDSEVKNSPEGVAFFDECRVALDKNSITTEECEHLIDEIVLKGNYNYVIVDADFSLSEHHLNILNKSDKVVFVTDGTELSNYKTMKAVNSIEIMETQKESLNITDKSVLLYNRFSSKTSKQIENCELDTVGGINKLEGLDSSSLAKKISEYQVLDNI